MSAKHEGSSSLTIRDTYALWKDGYDTLDIANMTGRPEHLVLQDISMCRSAIIRQPYPYSPYAVPTNAHTPSPMRRMGIYNPRISARPHGSLIERNAKILAAVDSGKTLEVVAEEFGMSKQRVWQIRSNARVAKIVASRSVSSS